MDEPDDGLTCDPCKEGRCHECEGGCCWHGCPCDCGDPDCGWYDRCDDADFRPIETVELPGISR
ncbi:hypothetical protein [Micromonospora robiginosa]|uniref:Uncharacterized protein n=1 Tax=Micromonospora robiginosa TaxID=2749844 RepID=A0A7L6B8U7_9ACTN|nr:hypothetical protein [Micromonospora ferruginea]QLQ37970.1 hypothetical protein H1D33_03495 [Micromonospora ferruginea]